MVVFVLVFWVAFVLFFIVIVVIFIVVVMIMIIVVITIIIIIIWDKKLVFRIVLNQWNGSNKVKILPQNRRPLEKLKSPSPIKKKVAIKIIFH